MKILLSFIAVSCLNAAFLYPLFIGGLGRPVSWLLVACLTAVGAGSIYLLVRFRKHL
jgi:hypothetical protein